jgi:hypothetical protein
MMGNGELISLLFFGDASLPATGAQVYYGRYLSVVSLGQPCGRGTASKPSCAQWWV